MPDTDLMTTAEVCDLLRTTRQSLHRWEDEGLFPRAIRVGPGTLRWRRSDIDRFIDQGGVEAARRRHRDQVLGDLAAEQEADRLRAYGYSEAQILLRRFQRLSTDPDAADVWANHHDTPAGTWWDVGGHCIPQALKQFRHAATLAGYLVPGDGEPLDRWLDHLRQQFPDEFTMGPVGTEYDDDGTELGTNTTGRLTTPVLLSVLAARRLMEREVDANVGPGEQVGEDLPGDRA